jgi:hypothetical protein
MDRKAVDREAALVERLVAADGGQKEACAVLLEHVAKKGVAILTAQDVHKDVPTIHNFAGKYHDTVEHLGYGMFRGHTEHGNFTFDAGGAMNHDGGVSWTTLDADANVLRDLRYDMRKVQKALEELAAARTAALGEEPAADDMTAAKGDLERVLSGAVGTQVRLSARTVGHAYLWLEQEFRGGFGVMDAVLSSVTLKVGMSLARPLPDGTYAGWASLEWEHKGGGSNGHKFMAVWWVPDKGAWVTETR